VKRERDEAEQSLPCSAEAKNDGATNAHIRLHGVTLT
jgi:hypothetical protein